MTADPNLGCKVLRDVQATLRDLMPTDNVEPEATNPQQLANTFSQLDFQETSETGSDSSLPETAIKAQADRINYKLDLALSPMDIWLEFLLLVDSMNDMREHIRSIWERQVAGTVDLAAAAVATNAAHEVVQHMIEDFETKVNAQVNYEDLTRRCFKLFSGNQISLDPTKFECGDAVYHFAEDSYFWMNFLKNRLMDAQLPVGKLYPPSEILYFQQLKKDISETSDFFEASEVRHYFEVIFGSLITIMDLDERPFYDETIRRMMDVIKKKGSSFDLAFAAQVFIDIAHITYDEPDAPRQELLRHLSVLQSGFNSLKKSHEKVRTKLFGEEELKKLQLVSNEIDRIKKAVKTMSDVQNAPVLMGLLLFHVRHLAFDTSVGVCNRLPYVHCCAHLVNAMRISNNLEKRWLDIEETEKLLGSKALWVGAEAPTNMVRARDNFAVRSGTSISAVGSRRDRPATESSQRSKAGARLFENVAKLQDKLYDTLHNPERSPFSCDGLEKVLQQAGYNSKALINDEARSLIAELENKRRQRETRQDLSAGEPAVHGEDSGSGSAFFRPSACPERLIERLLQALQHEANISRFPLFRLHGECKDALYAIAASCEDEMRLNHDPIDHDSGDNFAKFTDLILQEAAGLIGGRANTTLLVLAAETVKQRIQAGKTATAFKTMKIVDADAKVQFVDYDLKKNEGKEIQEHSLKEGWTEHRPSKDWPIIVIKDGKWHAAPQQDDGNDS